MKKTVRGLHIVVLLLLLVLLSSVVAFSGSDSSKSNMSFTKGSYNVNAGDTWTIYLSGSSPNAVSWDNTNSDAVEIVSSNTRSIEVKALSEGNSIISAIDSNGNTAKCSIFVTVKPISLSCDSFSIGLGNSRSIQADSDYDISWKSSNDDIVSIEDTWYYNEATIVANGLGTAEITATNEYGAVAKCTVTVLESYLELSDYKLVFNDEDEGESIYVISGSVSSVVSSNSKIATAQWDEYENCITIYPDYPGTAKITANEVNGAKQIITVNVVRSFSLNRFKLVFDNYNNYNREYDIASFADDNSCDVFNRNGFIEKVLSKNKKVAKTLFYDSYWRVIPTGIGETGVECVDGYGQRKTIKVVVTKKWFMGYLKEKSYAKKARYGDSVVKGKTLPYGSVSLTIGKKKYSKKAGKSGLFSIKIPVRKIGEKIKLLFSYSSNGNAVTCYRNYKISKPKTKMSCSTVYRKSKYLVIRLKNVHKNDVITVKNGKTKYKKRIKKDAKKKTIKIKLKTIKRAGSKISAVIKNKFKQRLIRKRSKIYYAANVKKGMSKRQCKLVPGWEHPDEVYKSGRRTLWWYDDNGDGLIIDSYLEFYNGRLIDWGY